MNEELQEMKNDLIEKEIKELKKTIENLPDTITAKMESTMNLKIDLAIRGVKLDFYKALVPIILGLLLEAAGVIFSFIK